MLKERQLTCIEASTLSEVEKYCKDSKTRPDIIVINGAYFIGRMQDGDILYDFYFNKHYLSFSISGGMYEDETENYSVHSYNFDKYSTIDWMALQ